MDFEDSGPRFNAPALGIRLEGVHRLGVSGASTRKGLGLRGSFSLCWTLGLGGLRAWDVFLCSWVWGLEGSGLGGFKGLVG